MLLQPICQSRGSRGGRDSSPHPSPPRGSLLGMLGGGDTSKTPKHIKTTKREVSKSPILFPLSNSPEQESGQELRLPLRTIM